MSAIASPSQSQSQMTPEPGHDNFEYASHCTCGEKLEMKTSWTFKNPGRRFLVCPKDVVRGCRFFKWVDLSFPAEARKIINYLMDEKKELYTCNAQVNIERAELKTAIEKLKDEYQRKVAMLEGELLMAKSKNAQGKWWMGTCVCLFVALVATWLMLIV